MESIITITLVSALIFIVATNFNGENDVIETKENYLLWLEQRIVKLQKEYDEMICYHTDPEFLMKMVKGGKLKAYKEMREYIKTH